MSESELDYLKDHEAIWAKGVFNRGVNASRYSSEYEFILATVLGYSAALACVPISEYSFKFIVSKGCVE
jgi:hypothetical protein